MARTVYKALTGREYDGPSVQGSAVLGPAQSMRALLARAFGFSG
jgi:hypothetical protein